MCYNNPVMKYTNICGYRTLNQYVDYKLSLLKDKEPTYELLYELMFNDESNIMFERSRGVKIEKVTYGEAKKKVDLYAKNIKAKLHNLPKHAVVGIYLDNDETWIEIFWAILKAGFNPLLLNLRLSNEILNKVLKDTNCQVVIGKEDTKLNAEIVLPSDLVNENIEEQNYEFGEAIYVMSSGTTNNVKLCAYTAKEFFNIVKQARYVITNNPLAKKHYEGELKLLAFLPFYHIFGLVALYTWFSYFARTFVILNDLAPQTIQNTIRRHHVTHIFAVPLFWEKTYESAIKVIKSRGEKTYNKFLKGMNIADKIGDVPLLGKLFIKSAFKEVRQNLFGDSVYFMITGGSHIDKKVISFFNNIGYHLANGYGMSEIGITSFELSNKNKLLNSCSIGNPLPGVEYQTNEEHELLINSPCAASYVIEGEKKTDVANTWFNSHDLAEYKNGRYYLLGRSDDLVVSVTGENLNPNIVEELLFVEDTNGVCLIKDKETRVPVLLVSINKFLRKEKVDAISNKIKELINQNNLGNQIGKIDFVTEEFISGDEFKKNRKKIEDRYFSGDMLRYCFETSDELEDEINKTVKKYFAIALDKKAEDIALDADFFLDEGGTSLDYFALISKLQNDMGVNLVATDKNPLHTVRQVSDYLRSHL